MQNPLIDAVLFLRSLDPLLVKGVININNIDGSLPVIAEAQEVFVNLWLNCFTPVLETFEIAYSKYLFIEEDSDLFTNFNVIPILYDVYEACEHALSSLTLTRNEMDGMFANGINPLVDHIPDMELCKSVYDGSKFGWFKLVSVLQITSNKCITHIHNLT